MTRAIDLTGSSFGRLSVIQRHIGALPRYGIHWDCRCACGVAGVFHTQDLRQGKSRSCGCLQRELQGNRRRTHGKTKTRAFLVWQRMLGRCLNKNNHKYRIYGGRGICVCERWMKFENFFQDMGEAPQGMSLERINNNGNYEPANCKWATPAEQVRNRSITKLSVEAARIIRQKAASGMRQSALAREFGVTQTSIGYVVAGKQWA